MGEGALMTFPVDDILLGPAAFGRLHRLDGWIHHTGEEPGFTRAYAVNTAIWQRNNPGSYNFRVYDRRSDPRGVMLNVPYLEASGGINPASASWAPGRFPFLATELAKAGPCPRAGCPGPYRNPTMHHLQLSYVGRTAALNAGDEPANYLPDALELVRWSESLSIRGRAPLVHSKHGHWQSNRSDPGNRIWAAMFGSNDVLNDHLKQLDVSITGHAVRIRKGATARTIPAFDPSDYDNHAAAAPHAVDTTRTALGWVPGTNITLANGTIHDKRTRWFASNSIANGVVFYHESDAIGFTAPGDEEEVERLQDALDSANTRTASVKTTGVTSLRKAAKAERDHAAILDSAAKSIEAK